MERRRIKSPILSDRNGLPFPIRKDRFEHHVPLEHAMAAGVNVTRSRTDLCVGVRSEVLDHEVDEAAFALQQREELDGALGGVRRRRSGGVDAAGRLKEGWQPTFEQEAEKCRTRQLESSPDAHRKLPSLILT